MDVREAVEAIAQEYKKASVKFPAMRSPHEGLAIIEEEFIELREEIFKQHDVRSEERMQKEARQVAAMALRFMVDLT